MLSILAVCITLASICQELSPAEIANTINKSKEANLSNGIIDPNKIQIGQTLTFLFQDGTQKIITVENGDSQWKILKSKISALINAHGPVIQFPKDQTPADAEAKKIPPPISEGALIMSPGMVLLILISLALIALFFAVRQGLKKKSDEAKKDPVTSGPAMRRNGLTDENAFAYTNEVANRQFNNPNLQVREVQRGMLSGNNLEVFYAGNVTPQRRTFTNQSAYRGIVNINGTDQYVYFLQGCGNDVRMGNYFTGQNIQFIADATAPVLRPQPTTTEEKKADPKLTEPTMLQMVNAMAKVLETKGSGKMTITGIDNVKVEMFFSATPISFSANGHAKDILAIEEKTA